jgi:phosphoserine phosphatase RsbU/P
MSDPIDYLPCGYVAFEDNGAILSCNSTFCSWVGFTKENLSGKSIENVLTLATRIFYNTHFFPLIKLHGKAGEIFLTLKTADNRDIPVLAYADRTTEKNSGIIKCVFVQVRERKKYEEQLLFAKREAENALKENKQLIELTNSLEQQALELDQQYQRQVVVNDNLVQFSKIISHDLQEPIRKVQIFVDMISRDESIALNDRAKHYLTKIDAAGEKLKALTIALQQYVTIDGEKTTHQLNLNEIILSAKARAIDSRQFSDFDFEVEPMPVIEGYSNQLELMFFHLIDNSIQFRNVNRRLSIKINCLLLEENIFKSTRSKYKYKEHLRISFADNGIGFSDQYKDYVFELLKKGDNSSRGLGLGLSLVKKVVNNHSGVVQVESQPGLGTRFEIELPSKLFVQTRHGSN